MSLAVTPLLEELLEITRAVLALPDPDFEVWEKYQEKRDAIFAVLEAASFQFDGEDRDAAVSLIREILEDETVLEKKIQARLGSLREQMASVARGRQALRGYASVRSLTLLHCSV